MWVGRFKCLQTECHSVALPRLGGAWGSSCLPPSPCPPQSHHRCPSPSLPSHTGLYSPPPLPHFPAEGLEPSTEIRGLFSQEFGGDCGSGPQGTEGGAEEGRVGLSSRWVSLGPQILQGLVISALSGWLCRHRGEDSISTPTPFSCRPQMFQLPLTTSLC